jgi:hypothetical protein
VLGCTWYGETDQRDVNIGAPDLDAYYWAASLPHLPETSVAITARYPKARYFSFHIYDEHGQPLDSTYDVRITPDPGGENPYRGSVRGPAADHYTLRVSFRAKPAHPATNTLYAPDSGAHSFLLVYRVYVPTDPTSPQGSVPFPQVQVTGPSGTTVTTGACSTTPPPFGSALWSRAAATDYPDGAPRPTVAGAARTPVWKRQFGSALGNQQNAYLATTISRQFGDLVVIHTRAPSFPDNRAGVAPWHRTQLRYWSFCTYDTQGQAGFGCAADYTAVIRHGWITYVVSDPGKRPANAHRSNGVTWLPWGGTQYGAQILYRTMLPDPSYRYAAQHITAPGEDASRVLGAYYPHAVYCTVATFARGGWRACFAAARNP